MSAPYAPLCADHTKCSCYDHGPKPDHKQFKSLYRGLTTNIKKIYSFQLSRLPPGTPIESVCYESGVCSLKVVGYDKEKDLWILQDQDWNNFIYSYNYVVSYQEVSDVPRQ